MPWAARLADWGQVTAYSGHRGNAEAETARPTDSPVAPRGSYIGRRWSISVPPSSNAALRPIHSAIRVKMSKSKTCATATCRRVPTGGGLALAAALLARRCPSGRATVHRAEGRQQGKGMSDRVKRVRPVLLVVNRQKNRYGTGIADECDCAVARRTPRRRGVSDASTIFTPLEFMLTD